MIKISELDNWEDGINKILVGNCLDLIKKIPDNSIDLLYTDPPYDQQISGKGNIASKFDYRRKQLEEISNFELEKFFEIIKPKLKAFHAYIWTSKNLLDWYITFAKKNNYNWDILIYAKRNPVPAYNNS